MCIDELEDWRNNEARPSQPSEGLRCSCATAGDDSSCEFHYPAEPSEGLEQVLDELCVTPDKTWCQRGRTELREILARHFSGGKGAPLQTRFAEFDDVDHPCNKWWKEYGQFMMSGGRRIQFIWACRGWIAREQLGEGVEVTGESIREDKLAALSGGSEGPGNIKALITEVIRDIAELPDRTSPDDWPEAMIVTGEELEIILERNFAQFFRPISESPCKFRVGQRVHWQGQTGDCSGMITAINRPENSGYVLTVDIGDGAEMYMLESDVSESNGEPKI